MSTIKVLMNGKHIVTNVGTSVAQLLLQSPHSGKFPAIGAVVNSHLDGLYHSLTADAEVKTIDLSSREGMDIYRRTTTLLLYSALHDIAPSAKISVGQSISDGYFYETHNCAVDKKFTKQLEDRMKAIVDADFPLIPETKTMEEAMAILSSEGQMDSVALLRQLRRSNFTLINVGGYYGSIYGPVAYRTGLINNFSIYPYEHGFVLAFPDDKGAVTQKINSQPKLFGTYLETKRWYELMNVENIAQLNEHCIRGRISDLVKVAEALHERKVAEIADNVVAKKNSRLVLIAGPSGSGKTTFMKRLAIQLRIHGIEPVTISIDNYYVDREENPRHEDGTFDFERIEALDVKLLNEHLAQLLNGDEVVMPSYSFALGTRDHARSRKIKLHKNQMLMIEGIHGLNDALTPSVPPNHKFKIFVSALTQLCIDNHNRIFTTDTRLVRRIIRDRLFRGTRAEKTIETWPSVRAGEKKYIFPYQESADAVFNSALVYEPALLKPYAERYLMEVPREHRSFMESARLIRFFSYLIPILAQEIPHTSILREFIGGSAFRYT